jgi:succinate-semialdehyde dehydrogenase/glutarate-semialdehyde dehydrogenase
LELGGSDPFVVLADADLGAAVRGAVLARHLNGGQSCIAAKRFIVEAALYEPFLAALTEAIAALRLGDPENEATDVGPLARADLVTELHAQVETTVRQGARCLRGGQKLPPPGFFYPPTLLADVRPGMAAFEEETFGPVTAVVRAEDAEDALRLANASRFGLGASLWTSRARGKELARRIEAGHVAVNGIVKSDPRLPFGGIKESGYGRELAREGLLAFVNVKSVWIG